MRTKWAMNVFTLLAVFVSGLYIPQYGAPVDGSASAQETKKNDNDITPGPVKITVILERKYLDGEISEEKVIETIWSMKDFWAKYKEWQLLDMSENQVVLRQQIDDISPLLKANGYFGITDDGILTIYNGKPGHSNIIQSFFHIDLGKLESAKWEQLKKGIPIKTKDRYEEVLESFKNYSKEGNQS
ncbi:regulator [Bacillus methanolicus]|uniref:intercompartmental signaling factor BofC n=1 Tax=Bacillus methanolicus TaxID=1471 RepID=UPI002380AE07|nr:intercompartmental signaling factor BofC [Bacillus methanolicus]MDE3839746.1 regulator [Bacillus methanolicus]